MVDGGGGGSMAVCAAAVDDTTVLVLKNVVCSCRLSAFSWQTKDK